MTRADFDRSELAHVLSLPEAVVDALITHRVLVAHEDRVAAADVEAFFRGGLLSTYRAIAASEATAAPEAPVRADNPEITLTFDADSNAAAASSASDGAPIITRSFIEYANDARSSKRELRIAPRYVPRRPVAGNYRGVDFTLLQISTTGLRIRHIETLRPGDEANVTFVLRGRSKSFVLRSRVVWTSISQHEGAASYCVSGLRVVENFDQLRKAIQAMRDDGNLELEDVAQSPEGAPAGLTGLSDDDVAAIIRAVRKFSTDPTEASRWYARGRYSTTDARLPDAIPQRPRDREEILGIWEYLDRKIDPQAITGVVAWIRRSRSAAAL